jgi:DNA-binding response OmpR family regulator
MGNDASGVRVAVIDDDSGLLTLLERRFAPLRWESEVVPYPAGPEQLAAMRLHAVVINPALTGLEYLERLAHALPGVALLACSPPASVADRVRALRAGADDWVTKPCHPEELISVVEATLRRHRRTELAVLDPPTVAGELIIRPELHQAFVGELSLELTAREFEILQLLVQSDRVLRREEIYERVWGYAMAHGDRSVDVFVRKLRQKLRGCSPAWEYIHTHFGVGYRFAPVADESQVPADIPGTGDETDRSQLVYTVASDS